MVRMDPTGRTATRRTTATGRRGRGAGRGADANAAVEPCQSKRRIMPRRRRRIAGSVAREVEKATDLPPHIADMIESMVVHPISQSTVGRLYNPEGYLRDGPRGMYDVVNTTHMTPWKEGKGRRKR